VLPGLRDRIVMMYKPQKRSHPSYSHNIYSPFDTPQKKLKTQTNNNNYPSHLTDYDVYNQDHKWSNPSYSHNIYNPFDTPQKH